MKRLKTTYIVVHCADTKAGMDIGREEINQWHLERGWNGIGYHEVIRRDGTVEEGRDITDVGAHVEGYNSVSIGICMVGGKGEDGKPESNFTLWQFDTLKERLKFYMEMFPKAEIVGHHNLNPGKACPCFDVRKWVKENLA